MLTVGYAFILTRLQGSQGSKFEASQILDFLVGGIVVLGFRFFFGGGVLKDSYSVVVLLCSCSGGVFAFRVSGRSWAS